MVFYPNMVTRDVIIFYPPFIQNTKCNYAIANCDYMTCLDLKCVKNITFYEIMFTCTIKNVKSQFYLNSLLLKPKGYLFVSLPTFHPNKYLLARCASNQEITSIFGR